MFLAVQERSLQTRLKLMQAAGLLFRTQGYRSTSIDDILVESGIKKGAFFHHFASKEELARACLAEWDSSTGAMIAQSLDGIADPVERLRLGLQFFERVMGAPEMVKSCLAGTTLQEVSETSVPLREAANICMVNAAQRFSQLIANAAQHTGAAVDAAGLAKLWVATLQGALILYKGSRDIRDLAGPLKLAEQFILNAVAPRNV